MLMLYRSVALAVGWRRLKREETLILLGDLFWCVEATPMGTGSGSVMEEADLGGVSGRTLGVATAREPCTSGF